MRTNGKRKPKQSSLDLLCHFYLGHSTECIRLVNWKEKKTTTKNVALEKPCVFVCLTKVFLFHSWDCLLFYVHVKETMEQYVSLLQNADVLRKRWMDFVFLPSSSNFYFLFLVCVPYKCTCNAERCVCCT